MSCVTSAEGNGKATKGKFGREKRIERGRFGVEAGMFKKLTFQGKAGARLDFEGDFDTGSGSLIATSATLKVKSNLEPNEKFSPDEFISVPFRFLSATIIEGHELEISEKVLKKAVKLWDNKPVQVDHLFNIEDNIGITSNPIWDGESEPPGVNGWLHINKIRDAEKGQAVSQGLKMGTVESTSVWFWFDWEPSHPDLDEAVFWEMLGQEVNSRRVTIVLTKITDVWEQSLVLLGADVNAKKLSRNDSGSQFAEDETYKCECIDCGYTIMTQSHCANLTCAECGGQMRRAERPGGGDSRGAQDEDGWVLNTAGVTQAKSAISAGKINTGKWDGAAAEKEALGDPDNPNWTRYGKWHLAHRSEGEKETKAYWGYPFGDGTEVYTAGLRAIISAASGGRGAEEQKAIAEAARNLLELANEKIETSKEAKMLEKLRKLFGLPDEATEDEVMGVVSTAKTKAEKHDVALKAVQDAGIAALGVLVEKKVEVSPNLKAMLEGADEDGIRYASAEITRILVEKLPESGRSSKTSDPNASAEPESTEPAEGFKAAGVVPHR